VVGAAAAIDVRESQVLYCRNDRAEPVPAG